MKEQITCTICHEPYPLEHLVEFQGELCCPSCLGVETVFCIHCGTQIWRDDNACDDGTPLCRSCYNDYYYSCSHCGRLIHHNNTYFAADDDEEPYCHDCYVQYCESHSIHEYFYKSEPHFYGEGNRFFCSELLGKDSSPERRTASTVPKTASAGFPTAGKPSASAAGFETFSKRCEVGCQLVHRLFGRGTVMTRDNDIITVYFSSGHSKKLSVSAMFAQNLLRE